MPDEDRRPIGGGRRQIGGRRRRPIFSKARAVRDDLPEGDNTPDDDGDRRL
jgi:hypothetical protein